MSEIKIPRNTRLSKKRTNGIMTCCGPIYSCVAQIFLECAGREIGCHDTIAILPKGNCDRNSIVDSITDNTAGKLFAAQGWLVKGYNNKKYTRCPICAKVISKK